ncbi:MAG: hypothetical protein J7577_23020 [Sphingobacteriaceae bacterium]|nr:hypothetical protein [Sphingobacteriaceae bacterium]
MKTSLKNFCSLVAGIIFFTSCNNTVPSSDSELTRPSESREEIGFSKADTVNNFKVTPSYPHVKVVIHQMAGYGQDSVFAQQSAVLLEQIVNSPQFWDAVINNNYAHDQNLSSQQILDKIMLAHEVDGPGGSDHVIDLRLRTINNQDDDPIWMRRCEPGSSTGTIGIDGGGSGIAAVCPQWLRSTAQSNQPAWLAAHFMHEYMHILGFRHPNKKPKSVPYKIHAIIEMLGEN